MSMEDMEAMQMGDGGSGHDHSMNSMTHNNMSGMDTGNIINYDNLTDDEIEHMNMVWYMKTMPGRSGNFVGHFLPAIFFFGFATFLLINALIRARNLPSGRGFAEIHIPENDPIFLRRLAFIVMFATTVGMGQEMYGGIIFEGKPFYQLAHLTLYLGYFITGFCAVWETYGRLPWDTHRGAMAVGMVADYLMWYRHGTMKRLPTDQTIHILLAYINLVNAGVVLFSMRFTDSVVAYLANWYLMILQAFWLLLAGTYECCIDLPMHDIPTYLALLSILLVFAVAIVYICFGPAVAPTNNRGHDRLAYLGEFEALKSHASDDEDEGEAC